MTVSKVGDHSREWPEGSLYNSYYMGGCYSIPWIALLHPWSLHYNAEC